MCSPQSEPLSIITARAWAFLTRPVQTTTDPTGTTNTQTKTLDNFKYLICVSQQQNLIWARLCPKRPFVLLFWTVVSPCYERGVGGGAEETRQHTSPYSLKGKCLSAFIYYSAAEAGILIDHSHSGDNPIVFDSLH